MPLFKSKSTREAEARARGVVSVTVPAQRAAKVIEDHVARGWVLTSNTYAGQGPEIMDVRWSLQTLVFTWPTTTAAAPDTTQAPPVA